MDSLVVVDFGGQTTQLIARRIREAGVYCEIVPHDAPPQSALGLQPLGFVLSGGPASVYQAGSPQIPGYLLDQRRPILGICYGMQAMTHALGGRVAASARREFGPAQVEVHAENPLVPVGEHPVWMSHGDRIEALPPGFTGLAASPDSPLAGMGDPDRRWYGLQFHPEVRHTPVGAEILRRFAVEICGARPEWTPDSILQTSLDRIREQVGDETALAGVSGGVDSSVAAALVHRAVGDRLTCVFVDTGLMRAGEPEAVVHAFRETLGARLLAVNASESFLDALAEEVDPEAKRRIIGERFIRVFEEQARRAGSPRFLVQGTIYPDVVESSGPERRKAARIKTHHNVAGLPEDMRFQLVEPLRHLFKDEVRRLGESLGLPEDLVWRQPFPGPGLAVRCLGAVTPDRLERVRTADAIVQQELGAADLLRRGTAQAFAVLLPVRSVGVMGDGRSYGETVAVRAVETDDFMTADWARLPEAVLARISRRIVNEVPGVSRVVYDITSKPPATIEWE